MSDTLKIIIYGTIMIFFGMMGFEGVSRAMEFKSLESFLGHSFLAIIFTGIAVIIFKKANI